MHLPSPAVLGGIYGTSELLLAVLKRSKSSSKGHDRGSLLVLWSVIGVSVSAAIVASTIRLGFELPRALYTYGVGVYFLGLAVRWYSILYLGRFFTVDVAIRGDHHLVDSGPYRFVRHPSYSGALLAFTGLGVCMLNWISVLIVIVPITSAFLYRIQVEELALRVALGDSYRSYSVRTKRIIPFVF